MDDSQQFNLKFYKPEVPMAAVHSNQATLMTSNRDVKPQIQKQYDESKKRNMNVVEFAKYDIILHSSHGRFSKDKLGYKLKVSWIDILLMRKDLKLSLAQMSYHILGTQQHGVMEIWCNFCFIRLSITYKY